MFVKHMFVALIAGSLIAVPAEKARADDTAAILGAAALIGGIVLHQAHRKKQRDRAASQQRQSQRQSTTQRRSAPTLSAAQLELNRTQQSALNYFGYDVGAVDGILGRKSRAGASAYQADMGYPADGTLNAEERAFLISSHQRALASAHVAPYDSIVASEGQRGLLKTYHNEAMGIPTPDPGVRVVATLPDPAPAPETLTAKTVTSEATLPSFNFGQEGASIAEHCSEINLLTAANGGLTTAADMRDPDMALNEQFCLARTQAMAEGARVEATITDLTPALIEQRCRGLTRAMRATITQLPEASPKNVMRSTEKVIRASGQPRDQLVAAGQVCLGVGYRTDDVDMALAAGVLLSTAGKPGYGEIVSHHMAQGFGVTGADPDLSNAWMDFALKAETGGNRVLGQTPDRLAILAAASGQEVQDTASLPAFPSSAKN